MMKIRLSEISIGETQRIMNVTHLSVHSFKHYRRNISEDSYEEMYTEESTVMILRRGSSEDFASIKTLCVNMIRDFQENMK
jgi:hypothetical protein